MSDKKYFHGLILAGLLLIFSIGSLVVYWEKEIKNFWGNEIKEVKIRENIFQAEVAATPAKKNRGLSGRKNLCENCAMIFLFNERSLYSFWMKEMNFDLDIIWINNNEIVYIAKNVSREKELELIRPNHEADKVLEINSGLADKLGIKIGDRVEF